MQAHISREIWNLITPLDECIVCYHQVYTVKYKPDELIDRYKARLIAKDFSQTNSIDYFETFSLAVHLNSIRILLSLTMNLDWPLFQLDIKNIFIYDDLQEKMYMEKFLRYIVQRENAV